MNTNTIYGLSNSEYTALFDALRRTEQECAVPQLVDAVLRMAAIKSNHYLVSAFVEELQTALDDTKDGINAVGAWAYSTAVLFLEQFKTHREDEEALRAALVTREGMSGHAFADLAYNYASRW